MIIITHDVNEQKRLGACIGKHITEKTVIFLDGELGSGKTTLTQGIGQGLKIEEVINSPTFTIAKQYFGDRELNHLDVYRLEGLDEDMGLEDYVFEDSVLVVEWSKFVDTSMFDEYLKIECEYCDEGRKVVLSAQGSSHEALLEKVKLCYI